MGEMRIFINFIGPCWHCYTLKEGKVRFLLILFAGTQPLLLLKRWVCIVIVRFLWLWDFYEFENRLKCTEKKLENVHTSEHFPVFFQCTYTYSIFCRCLFFVWQFSLFILMLLVIDSVLIDICCLLSLFTSFFCKYYCWEQTEVHWKKTGKCSYEWTFSSFFPVHLHVLNFLPLFIFCVTFFSIYFDVISDWQCAYWHMLFAFFVYFFFL